ncbi:bifunctional 3-(3-hydroxy-phenyl)propionate/3-hydroxycinnamic acid hydroxylase [Klebsiella pneumoniae]
MTTSTPDIQPAVQHTAQVAIVGAGPVGLMMANYLGQMGISVLVVEKLATLIDYPRAIGIDDESLRAMQAVGLVNDVLPHTTPWHAMRFLTPKGRCFADIQPMTDEFGWSRRNAFIQPQVDAVMYHGLQRFPQVRCLFSREVEAFSQTGDGVTLNLKGPDGERETVRADWLVACDGGASFIRRTLNIPFEGKTAPNQWIVIDIANDPLATPHVYLCCDPVRPYVSAALPHGVRRFEFMVMPGETEAQLSEPHNMRRLLSKVLPDPDRVELIRQRVYTHNARLAERFRIDRVLLAGDAAHIMPVWQGQGYNSGMRDAFNLAWKLALVVNGKAGETLLDEVIGANFAIIGWGCNPQWGLDAGQIARWRAIGVRFIQVVPEVQIHREQDNAPGTLRVGDTQNRLKSWFAQHNTAIAVVRPDRFVAALAIPQTLGAQLTALAEKLTLATGDTAHAEEKVA